jgi:hypothetical protein
MTLLSGAEDSGAAEGDSAAGTSRHIAWAVLLQRVFEVDVLAVSYGAVVSAVPTGGLATSRTARMPALWVFFNRRVGGKKSKKPTNAPQLESNRSEDPVALMKWVGPRIGSMQGPAGPPHPA